MKKTTKVSLGGFTYDIEEDAYILLENYINSLKQKLSNDKDSQEIIKDIEERIGELLTEKKGNAEAISIEVIQEIIGILGKPEEIANDPNDSSQANYSTRTQKRLYRDSDHSYVAGVCSGLGEYFGTDPIVMRIIFIALTIFQGFGLLLYIILWIAVPRANSPKQKLEMKGEPINVSSIGKTIREEYSQVNESLKKKGAASFIEKLVYFIGRLVFWFIQVLLVIVKAIAIIIAVVLIVTMLILLFVVLNIVFFGGLLLSSAFPEIHGIPIGEVITSMFEFSSSIWITIPIFLVIAIPIFAILYLGIRILFRFKARDGIIGIVAAGIWIISIAILAMTIFYQAKSFTIRRNVTETVNLSTKLQKGGTLIIKANEIGDSLYTYHNRSFIFEDYSIEKINGQAIIKGRPSLTIAKCDKEFPVITFTRKARGANYLVAEMNAKKIVYNYTLKDSVLTFDSYFTVPAGEKWKLQELSITLQIPEDYKIYIDNSAESIMNLRQPAYKYWPDEIMDKKWSMKENILKELEE